MPNIQLLDGKKITFEKNINGFDLIKKISKSLEKKALIMEVNGKLRDLSFEIKEKACYKQENTPCKFEFMDIAKNCYNQ